MKKSEVKKWKEFIHVFGAFSFFVGPLIIFFTKENKEVKKHAEIALNWHFSFLIYFIACFFIPILGQFFQFVLVILNVIFCIIAFSKVNEKKIWVYPLSINFFDDNH